MAESPDRPDAPRYVVVGGGRPTPEQLAALTVALTPTAVPDQAPPDRPGGWARAALLEGVGARPFASPAELARHGG